MSTVSVHAGWKCAGSANCPAKGLLIYSRTNDRPACSATATDASREPVLRRTGEAFMPEANTELEPLLAAYPETVRELARTARQLILKLGPTLTETVDTKARVVGYGMGTGYSGL